ncbi:MAG: 7-carboxy-7-deazaguanine synthase QueE [Bacteroides sp.]|nr:7-carboxy-7-deazaguanine synthase QueE [Ruminococcus flavefaciens]MCM1555058.1 7-carboxy-7-deazaguanine synthase QueE [Bacteroides sp.]MCM1555491.1 7-carboxy-7-deazaguanine synthase QueE [Bacteroides sp.]
MDSLPVVETFHSLQGEGTHAGWPAYFVRLAGCRNACPFCDTPQSWNPEGYPSVPVAELAREAARSGARHCVVTGGEPALHDLTALCAELKKAGLQRWLETSGSEPLSGAWEWICLSPKKNIEVLPEYYRSASELKVVIGQASDFDFAEQQAAQVSDACLCFLQPEWGEYKKILPQIIEYAKAHPRWNLSLQVHKLIGVE